MTSTRLFVLLGALVLALVLAFALQDVIHDTVILPLAYLWWVLGLYYHTLPQIALWACLVLLVLLMFFGSLAPDIMRKRRVEKETKPIQGPVEGLAMSLEKARGGIYLKWQIAHRLGNLARDLLVQRGDRVNAKSLGPLVGRDWHPSQPVDEYLDVGLNGSFADYPNPPWPFGRPQVTPLDLEVDEAVEFLELQLESDGRH